MTVSLLVVPLISAVPPTEVTCTAKIYSPHLYQQSARGRGRGETEQAPAEESRQRQIRVGSGNREHAV